MGDGKPMTHAGYVRAVAEALEAAGVPVADWRADPGTPRVGWIPFDLARQTRIHGRVVWDHDAAGISWSEDHGWSMLTVDDPGGRDARTTEVLALDPASAPASVVHAALRHAGLPTGPEPPGTHPATPAEEALPRYPQRRTKSVDGPLPGAQGQG